MDSEYCPDLQTLLQRKEYFLGVFENQYYRITRKYLDTVGVLQRLYYTRFDPIKEEVKANLVMIHGFGEHSSRFLDFAECFVQEGYIVHLIDLRGYGYSGGARGVSMMEEMMKDIEVCMKQADENYPLFVLGHSMGGLLVTSIGCRNPNLKIAGFISSSALLGDPTDRKIDQFKKDALQLAGGFLGDILVNSMINCASLTKNNRNIKSIIDDPHNVPFFGMKMAKSMLYTISVIQPSAKYFKYPLLIYHGKRDGITNYKDSIRFFNKAGSTDKSIKLFETGYHEMHHDKESDELENLIINWLNNRVKNAPKFSKDFTITTKVPSITTKRMQYMKRMFMFLLLSYLFFIVKNWNRYPNARPSFLKKLFLPLLIFLSNTFTKSN